MSDIEAFIAAPSQKSLDACTKEQLLLLAEHYSVVIKGNKCVNENI